MFRTPVLCFRHGDGFVIPLPYGSNADWVRNVRATGGAQLRRTGSTIAVTNPRLADDDTRLPKPLNAVSSRIQVLLVDLDAGAEGVGTEE